MKIVNVTKKFNYLITNTMLDELLSPEWQAKEEMQAIINSQEDDL
jgi:hypothetical protein